MARTRQPGTEKCEYGNEIVPILALIFQEEFFSGLIKANRSSPFVLFEGFIRPPRPKHSISISA